MNAAGPPRLCPACAAAPRAVFPLTPGVWLRQCPSCGLGWWDWPAFDPAGFYDREYFQSSHAAKGYDDYAALEVGLRVTARARLRRIERLRVGAAPLGCATRGQLLDVGCGTGCFLDEARQRGWEVGGIETSAYATEQARERGLPVSGGPIEELALPRDSYDCITLWDVLEHLRDPAGVLRKLGGALRTGGVLALSTGDVTSLCARWSGPRWHLFTLPEHLFFFSPASLRRLLRPAGCRIRCVAREVNWVPVQYVLERLRKTFVPPTTARVAGCAAEQRETGLWARARGRLTRLTVPATLFDVLGVYAVRAAPREA